MKGLRPALGRRRADGPLLGLLPASPLLPAAMIFLSLPPCSLPPSTTSLASKALSASPSLFLLPKVPGLGQVSLALDLLLVVHSAWTPRFSSSQGPIPDAIRPPSPVVALTSHLACSFPESRGPGLGRTWTPAHESQGRQVVQVAAPRVCPTELVRRVGPFGRGAATSVSFINAHPPPVGLQPPPKVSMVGQGCGTPKWNPKFHGVAENSVSTRNQSIGPADRYAAPSCSSPLSHLPNSQHPSRGHLRVGQAGPADGREPKVNPSTICSPQMLVT